MDTAEFHERSKVLEALPDEGQIYLSPTGQVRYRGRTLLLLQCPEAYCDEERLRTYFEQVVPKQVTRVQVRPQKRSALIEFQTQRAAAAALRKAPNTTTSALGNRPNFRLRYYIPPAARASLQRWQAAYPPQNAFGPAMIPEERTGTSAGASVNAAKSSLQSITRSTTEATAFPPPTQTSGYQALPGTLNETWETASRTASTVGTFPEQRISVFQASMPATTTAHSDAHHEDLNAQHDETLRSDALPPNARSTTDPWTKHREPVFASGEHGDSQQQAGSSASTALPLPLDAQPALLGTCLMMCPLEEQHQRRMQRDVHVLEMSLNPECTLEPNPQLMVKKFARPAAGAEAVRPEQVRPPHVLRQTMEYLLQHIVDREDVPFHEVYAFLRDRTRSIRQDFTYQGIYDTNCAWVHEQCVRFHILAEYRLAVSGPEVFSSKQNMEQLDKCLLALCHLYREAARQGRSVSAHRSEFEAYYLLLQNRNDAVIQILRELDPETLHSEQVQLALQVIRARQAGDFQAFFGRLLAQVSFLQACMMHRHFGMMRLWALEQLARAAARQEVWPLSALVSLLAFDDDGDAAAFLRSCDLHVTVDGDSVALATLEPHVSRLRAKTADATQATLRPLYWFVGQRCVERKALGLKPSEIIQGKVPPASREQCLRERIAAELARQRSERQVASKDPHVAVPATANSAPFSQDRSDSHQMSVELRSGVPGAAGGEKWSDACPRNEMASSSSGSGSGSGNCISVDLPTACVRNAQSLLEPRPSPEAATKEPVAFGSQVGTPQMHECTAGVDRDVHDSERAQRLQDARPLLLQTGTNTPTASISGRGKVSAADAYAADAQQPAAAEGSRRREWNAVATAAVNAPVQAAAAVMVPASQRTIRPEEVSERAVARSPWSSTGQTGIVPPTKPASASFQFDNKAQRQATDPAAAAAAAAAAAEMASDAVQRAPIEAIPALMTPHQTRATPTGRESGLEHSSVAVDDKTLAPSDVPRERPVTAMPPPIPPTGAALVRMEAAHDEQVEAALEQLDAQWLLARHEPAYAIEYLVLAGLMLERYLAQNLRERGGALPSSFWEQLTELESRLEQTHHVLGQLKQTAAQLSAASRPASEVGPRINRLLRQIAAYQTAVERAVQAASKLREEATIAQTQRLLRDRLVQELVLRPSPLTRLVSLPLPPVAAAAAPEHPSTSPRVQQTAPPPETFAVLRLASSLAGDLRIGVWWPPHDIVCKDLVQGLCQDLCIRCNEQDDSESYAQHQRQQLQLVLPGNMCPDNLAGLLAVVRGDAPSACASPLKQVIRSKATEMSTDFAGQRRFPLVVLMMLSPLATTTPTPTSAMTTKRATPEGISCTKHLHDTVLVYENRKSAFACFAVRHTQNVSFDILWDWFQTQCISFPCISEPMPMLPLSVVLLKLSETDVPTVAAESTRDAPTDTSFTASGVAGIASRWASWASALRRWADVRTNSRHAETCYQIATITEQCVTTLQATMTDANQQHESFYLQTQLAGWVVRHLTELGAADMLVPATLWPQQTRCAASWGFAGALPAENRQYPNDPQSQASMESPDSAPSRWYRLVRQVRDERESFEHLKARLRECVFSSENKF
jgi:hypothetical protein